MKIRLSELRHIVRDILSEAFADTVPAHLDPKERELSQELPKWSKQNPGEVTKQASPADIKAKQVANILLKKGHGNDPASKKKITQQLKPFIEKMDPQDVFIADPDEIAQSFAAEVLGAKGD